ncbi:lamin tail domain-containing protein [Bacillus timonensis]|uniref:lamin tail domain-containing protein n=1 Tax=Bacillus timonensis TaxID=1033734 RepID=UPI000289C526|nr:lamin tail domain-containing protein [Bacillus timonensis]
MNFWQQMLKITFLFFFLLTCTASPEMVLAQRDTTAPVITHKPITTTKPLLPIKIKAEVTDDTAIQNVTLFYKTGDTTEFRKIKMSQNGQTYKAEIPGFHVFDEISYYIEANDGTNTARTGENTILVVQKEIDFTKMPQLLVTEIVPNSTNVGSADGFEFVEIYNNSDKPVHFKDYKLYYRYGKDPRTDVIWPTVTENLVIPARKTLVLWIINNQNNEQTVDDFNAHYGTKLKENESIVRVYSDGMANNSKRGIVVGTNTHREISVAYYYKSEVNKGIVYRYPTNKSTISKRIGTKEATPGQVESYQVPEKPVHIKKDSIPPTIEDITLTTEVNQEDNLELIAAVKDDNDVKSVRLFYKINHEDHFNEVILRQSYEDLLFHHTIQAPELIGREYLDYYYVVSDGTNEVKSETYRVTIKNELNHSNLRLNLKNDEMLRGKKVIKATSKDNAPMKLLIDGNEITEGIYRSLEHTAYFVFEVNGLNTYFQNAVTMGKEVLTIMDQDWLTEWKTFTIPIEPERLPVGNTTITVRSGNKASPFELWSKENRDDFHLRNVRLILGDGTVIRDPNYSDPNRILNMGDKYSHADFTFSVTEKEARSLTYKWNTLEVHDRNHLVTVQSGDEKVSSQVLVDNTAPSIKTNLKKKPYKGTFTIDVDVKDKLSGVEKTTVTLDGEEIEVPYKTASSKLKPGKHRLVVRAVDHVGNKKRKFFILK